MLYVKLLTRSMYREFSTLSNIDKILQNLNFHLWFVLLYYFNSSLSLSFYFYTAVFFRSIFSINLETKKENIEWIFDL